MNTKQKVKLSIKLFNRRMLAIAGSKSPVRKGEKICIFGFGRSGSTLLASALSHEHDAIDLGEYLRPRRYIKANFIWPKRPDRYLNSIANYYLKEKEKVILHVQPFHLNYFRTDPRNFVHYLVGNGWMFIFLIRELDKITLSEYRAQKRNQWINKSGEVKTVYDFFPDNLGEVFNELEHKHYSKSIIKLLASELKIKPNSVLVRYEDHLATPKLQKKLALILENKLAISSNFAQSDHEKNKELGLSKEDEAKLKEIQSFIARLENSAQD